MSDQRPAPLPAADGGSGGLPAVFLHSLAGSPEHWARRLAHLWPGRRAVALTLPGHGGVPAGTLRADALSDAIGRTIDGLGLQRFVLAGHSAGALLTAGYAAANPSRVAGLMLVDPGIDLSRVPTTEAVAFLAALRSPDGAQVSEAHWSSILAGARPTVRERVLADLRRTPREVITGMLEGLRRFDAVAALQAYPGPELAVITPLAENPLALHVLVPELRRVRIDETSHWPQLDEPEAFNRILDAFLAEAEAGAGTSIGPRRR